MPKLSINVNSEGKKWNSLYYVLKMTHRHLSQLQWFIRWNSGTGFCQIPELHSF